MSQNKHYAFSLEHWNNSVECPGCWEKVKFRCDCKGIVHTEFNDWVRNKVALYYWCSKCGEKSATQVRNFEIIEGSKEKIYFGSDDY